MKTIITSLNTFADKVGTCSSERTKDMVCWWAIGFVYGVVLLAGCFGH